MSASRNDWDDDQLMRAAIAGDNSAFSRICTRTRPHLVTHVGRQCVIYRVDRSLVDEISTTTMIRFVDEFKERNGQLKPDSVETDAIEWIKQIATEVVITCVNDELRQFADQSFINLFAPLRESLSPLQIQALHLCLVEGESTEKAARKMSVGDGEFLDLFCSGLSRMNDYFDDYCTDR